MDDCLVCRVEWTLHNRQWTTQTDKCQALHRYSYFSWWWAHSRPKHVEKRDKHTKKNCTPSWLYLQDDDAQFEIKTEICQIIYKQKLFEIIKITIELLLMQQRALWPVWTKLRYCCLLLQEVAVCSKIMASIYKTPQLQNPKQHNLSTPPIIKSSDLI